MGRKRKRPMPDSDDLLNHMHKKLTFDWASCIFGSVLF